MIKEIINKLFIFNYSHFEYRLKEILKLKSFRNNEYDVITYQNLKIYNFIEVQHKSTAKYSLMYSLILLSSVITLL
jgi:hypothetical protein